MIPSTLEGWWCICVLSCEVSRTFFWAATRITSLSSLTHLEENGVLANIEISYRGEEGPFCPPRESKASFPSWTLCHDTATPLEIPIKRPVGFSHSCIDNNLGFFFLMKAFYRVSLKKVFLEFERLCMMLLLFTGNTEIKILFFLLKQSKRTALIL